MAETNGTDAAEHNGEVHQNSGRALPSKSECTVLDTEVISSCAEPLVNCKKENGLHTRDLDSENEV